MSSLLTASPATDNAARAAGSSSGAAEDPRSGIDRIVTVAQPLASASSSVAPVRGRFPGPSTERPLVPSHLTSESTTAAFSRNYEPESIPAAEEATLHLDTHGADMPSVAAGALGSSPNGDTARVTRDSATSTDPTSSLGGTFSSSRAGTRHPNGSREATDLPALPREPLLTSSLSASKSTFRAMGSSHHSLSSSSAEERMSSPTTDPAYSSPTPAGGGERSLHSVTDSTVAGGTESSTSYTKTASSPRPAELASVEQRGTANASTSSFSSSHQPVSSIDAEKRSSVSHTDGTYISTIYTRGGERTLLSISNSSTSTDSSESSTFFSEISNPSDSLKSSVAQDRRNNISSDGSFVEPSTEPLLVHSSKLLTSTSAGSVQNTTLFNTDSELLTTAPMEQLGGRIVSVSMSTPVMVTETASPKATTIQGGTFEKATSSLLTMTNVDKCLSNPCPALATCNSTRGSYICQCPLGYELEKGKCNLVRIFIGQVPLKLNTTHGKYAELLHVEGEILAMLDGSLSGLPGYHHSTVKATREANFVHVSVQSTFALTSNVTFYDVISSVKSYIRACTSPTEACQFISSLKPLHRVGSLCKQKDPECDKETSECTDFDGVALCQCKSGYFKYNKMDHSCRACEDGYKLENETCVSCPFGLGGFNCGNPYQLITVVIAAAGGGLLLIMGIALIVTCCRKNKNDISKLIFKSGDFQMSPYAEYPKNPRAQEWGRETIEMQENGSTKNLLQMTDVYYSPTGLRNPELERNGLYPPYTGLPGSRHSCIYPGQYNPSFISDETRRRDYF
ncbi:PREDICTED: protein HEG homolog 1 [Tauraco erythrolophus]|uniref:protein HEG homolog 1 n=1 Tax=Tauraco erythrolophus TaxID=121530 RepID=UPI00052396BA|nr:PREDICTED: protein HEG homolog 1 [Tauraco erythrolophus]